MPDFDTSPKIVQILHTFFRILEQNITLLLNGFAFSVQSRALNRWLIEAVIGDSAASRVECAGLYAESEAVQQEGDVCSKIGKRVENLNDFG